MVALHGSVGVRVVEAVVVVILLPVGRYLPEHLDEPRLHELLVPFFPQLGAGSGAGIRRVIVVDVVSGSDKEVGLHAQDGGQGRIAQGLVVAFVLGTLKLGGAVLEKGVVHSRHHHKAHHGAPLPSGQGLEGGGGTEPGMCPIDTVAQPVVVARCRSQSRNPGLDDMVIPGHRSHPLGQPRVRKILCRRQLETGDPGAAGEVSVDQHGAPGQAGLQNHAGGGDFTRHFPLAVVDVGGGNAPAGQYEKGRDGRDDWCGSHGASFGRNLAEPAAPDYTWITAWHSEMGPRPARGGVSAGG